MSYIGNVPTTAAFPFDQFSGTGAQTAFTLSQAPASTTSIVVAVSGVVQNPNTYSVSNSTLTFTAAPPSGTNNIGVLFLGLPSIVGVPNAATVGIAQLSATGTKDATTFLRGDNTFATPSGGFSNMEVFTATGTFTVPAGITKVKVTVVGGGGGGGNANQNGCGPANGSGAGGGGTAIEVINGLTPSGTVAVTVGAGGAVATAGGTSSFGAYCSATGGSGGVSLSPSQIGNGGLGGIGSGGKLNIKGSAGIGVSGSYAETPNGGASYLGGGGLGSTVTGGGGTTAGGVGGSYGGGGGGGLSAAGVAAGGAGAAGVVIVEY